MVWIKLGIAVLSVLVMLWTLLFIFLKKPQRHRRARDVSLAMLGIVSFFAWWNLGHHHFDHYIHVWEHYHYLMGAKYPELR